MKRLGWVIDWEREISAHEVEYYRWTQWLFLKFFERGLAYRAAAPVNWCPNDQTVVAHEYVVDGRCDRCGTLVEARNLEQWFFKITAYADELLEYDLPEGGEWPERTKTIQRNWIGRSEGAEILFRIDELDADVPVFTTRPDTLFGATFFVLAPEHPLVERIASDEVREYVKRTAARRGEERAAEEEKTGVFTGDHATNPVNGERLPVYVADYVLMEYGTGAIMAVPAHDERDHEFARDVRPAGADGRRPAGRRAARGRRLLGAHRGRGAGQLGRVHRALVTRGEAGDRRAGCGSAGRAHPPCRTGSATGASRASATGAARSRSSTATTCGVVPVPEDELPVLLPEVDDYRPKGVPPLASNEEWLHVPCPRCGQDGPGARRTRWTPSSTPRGTSCATSTRATTRRRSTGARRLLVPGLAVHRRHRPRDGPPALLAFLRQGHEGDGARRLRRAVRPPVPPGLGADGRLEDVEVARERRRARTRWSTRTAPTPCALYILFMGPADQDMEWTDTGIEGIVRFLRRLWRVVARGRRARARRAARPTRRWRARRTRRSRR